MRNVTLSFFRRSASAWVALALLATLGSWIFSAQEPASSGDRTTIIINRSPLRIIEEENPGFSAVTVDATRNEIVAQDGAMEQLMVYDRLANTPPWAAMTEPKRLIAGRQTSLSDNCAVYVDPTGGDIYSVNNDVNNTLNIFSRQALGDVAPDRQLNTPHRTFGIAMDEEAQEMYITTQHPPSVLAYRKMAEGDEAPLRFLQGYKTQLAYVHGIAVDSKNQLMFVANRGAGTSLVPGAGFNTAPIVEKDGIRTWIQPEGGWGNRYRQNWFIPGSGKFDPPSITVYPLKASGNVPPIRVIQGSRTQLSWPSHIHIDVEHQELFVVNAFGDSVVVFRTTDGGNVAPIRVIKGPRTKLSYPHGVFLDEANQEIVVANFGNHSITVYPRTAEGDTPPLRVIRAAPEGTPTPLFGAVGALEYDTKRGQILAPN